MKEELPLHAVVHTSYFAKEKESILQVLSKHMCMHGLYMKAHGMYRHPLIQKQQYVMCICQHKKVLGWLPREDTMF